MAISARAVGSWAQASSGTTQTITLPTHAAGDMLIVRFGVKTAAIASTTLTCGTSGWQKLGQYANGSTNSGNGTGSVLLGVFYKEATSASETNPVITSSQTIAQSVGVAVSYQKASTEYWVTPVGDGGPDTTSGTSHSATIQSHVTATAGDLIDFFTGICDDTTMTVPTFTQSGLTLGTVAEYPATAGSFTAGSDMAADGGYRAVSSGTSSAAAVVTGTLSTSETGTSWTTRLRVTTTANVTLGLLESTPALYAPTLYLDQFITLPLLEQTAGGTPAHGQHLGVVYDAAASRTTTVLSLTSKTVTAGNTVFVGFGSYFDITATSVTDNLGNTYSRVQRFSGAYCADLWAAPVTTGGSITTITVNHPSTQYTEIIASEFSNIGTLSTTGGTNSGVSTTATWASSVTIPANGIVVGMVFASNAGDHTAGSASGTPSTSMTISGEYTAADISGSLSYAIAGGSSVTGFNGTTTIPSSNWSGVAGVYNPPSSTAAPTLYAPTLTQTGGASAQSITLGVLDAGNALYAPSLSTTNLISLGLLDAANALYAPSVTPAGVTITLVLLDGGAELYAPTLTAGPATITLPLLDGEPALYAPTVATAAQSVSLGLLDGARALYPPILTREFYISPSGSDTTGTGTISNPWQSLDKAYTEATAGVTVYCRGGTYSGTGTNLPYYITTSGTQQAPITVAAYPGETPIFDGTGISMGTQNVGFFFYDSASWHVLRGLTFRNWDLYNAVGQGSALLDTSSATAGGVHDILVEDCVFDGSVLTDPTNNDHVVYIGGGTDNVTITGCTIIGPGKTSAFGAGFHLFHDPGARYITFTRNIIKDCPTGILLWEPTSGGGTDYQLLHTTFIDCQYDADLRYGDDITIQNSASNATGDTIYRGAVGDTPNYVESYNFYGQSFVNYYLASGQTGNNAASDGTDAGALDAEWVVLGLLDGGRTLYAPTIAAGPTGITLPLLDGANALYAPTLAGGAVTVTLALLDAGNALYAPSLAPKNRITLGLLDGGNALYAPTLTPKNTIELGLLDGANALYAPALVGGSISVVLPLLDAGAALYAPTIYPDQFVALALLDAGAALFAPTLLPKNTITLALLDAGGLLYAPTIIPGPVVVFLDLLDGAATLYAPTLELVGGAVTQTLVIPFLNAGAELYPPTISSVSALIYGHTRDVNGRPIPFATVDVFVTATNTFYATTTSDAVGLYQVLVETGVEYFIVAYTAVEFGTSSRSLVGV
jgi:hypothetical protein